MKILSPKYNWGDHYDIRSGHNLYAKNMTEDFDEIRDFLYNHRSEVVIIDLNGDWLARNVAFGFILETQLTLRLVMTSVFETRPFQL